MTVSAWERMNFFEMIAKHKVKTEKYRKIFVSRLSRSKANPNYRVLQNEQELAAMLGGLGFVTIEPETLPFEVQISIFAAAEQVVFLGGSGVFNAVFCAPDTSVVTIESSNTYIGNSWPRWVFAMALFSGGKTLRIIPRDIRDGRSTSRAHGKN